MIKKIVKITEIVTKLKTFVIELLLTLLRFSSIIEYKNFREVLNMKKKVFILVLSFCVLALLACAFIPASADSSEATVAQSEYSAEKARFLNMLNHNFVYNSDFKNADVVTENSVLALLDRRDSQDTDYISETVVKGFVSDMYGIDIVDISEDELVHKDGYVYIVPRGFTSYKHVITKIVRNEDGSVTVISNVIMSPHDDDSFVTEAETLFVENEKSAFGYNIVYSTLKGVASGI